MKKAIEVGPLKAEPGEKVRGKIDIAEHADGYLSDYLPLAILNGSKPGVTLWLEAGFHGGEPGGVAAAFQLIDELDPREMKGTLIVEPCVNVLSILEGARYNPIDRGLMSVIEGTFIPTFSERLGKIRSDIQQVLQKGDYYLSLHETTHLGVPYVEIEWSDDPSPYEKKCIEFAEATNAPVIGGGPGAKHYSKRDNSYAKRCRVDFKEAGIYKITLESKEPYKQILNVLKFLQIIEGSPEPPEKEQIYCKEGLEVRANHRGLWVPKVKAGEIVEKGQVVAIVRNLMGDILEEVKSPFKGVPVIQREIGRYDPLSIDLTLSYGLLIGKIE